MSATGQVRVERHTQDGAAFAVVTIAFPPINAGGKAMRTALLAAFQNLDTDGLRGVVLTGEGGNFVGGADIREFDHPAEPPHLPEIIAAIETCAVPVVAAIDGAALGGGCEIALGCDARVLTPRAVIGLPEVTLGLIPGAGGTLRLPRIVGQARGIALITSGERLRGPAALSEGLADALAEPDALLQAAMAHAAGLNGKRLLRDLPVLPEDPEAIAMAAAAARKAGRGATAVDAAIKAIADSATLPADTALVNERETSLSLRRGPQSRALRHLFFAEKRAGRIDDGASPRPVQTVGIVGGGRMGQGIAAAFAQSGYAVRIVEQDDERRDAAIAGVAQIAKDLAARGRIADADTMTDRVTPATLTGLAPCELVVEAIVEDMDAKQALLRALDSICAPDCVLASNTSYLDLDVMGTALAQPARLGGLHFFNPAHVMKLVEVVAPGAIAPDALATLVAVARKLRKMPVIARVGEGFIGNRIFAAYRQQCEFLLEEGATPQEVDTAMREFGMAMGPFAVFDLAGLDIAWAQRKRQAATRDPAARYVTVADTLCQMGRFGRGAGRGWYDYRNDLRGAPDPEVLALAAQSAKANDVSQRSLAADEIESRLLAAMVNTACILLAEGVAARPGDIDVAMVHGYGFPRLAGGPLHWAASRDRAAVHADIAAMCAASGAGFAPAPNLDAVLDASA